mgnify:FL=1
MFNKISWREVFKIVCFVSVISGIILLLGFYFSYKNSPETMELYLYYPQSLVITLFCSLAISVTWGLKKFKIQQALNTMVATVVNTILTFILSYLLFLLVLVILVIKEAIQHPDNAANFGFWLISLNLAVPVFSIFIESEFLPYIFLFLVIFLGVVGWLGWRLLKEKNQVGN